MATLAELGIVVSAAGVQQGLGEAQKAFKKFEQDTSRTAETISKAWEFVKVALEAVAAVETVRKILEVTDAFHKMELQLAAVTGSASQGRAALAWVDEFASKTPFSMQAVTKAFQELWSVGINPTTGALQALADANAAVGGTDQTLEQLVGTIARIKETGIVSLRELQRTLQNEIPGAGRIMAQQMGLSMDELDRRVKAGAVTADQAIGALLAGLQSQFGGQALAQMHTFSGAWKELKDQMDELFRSLGEAGITELAIQGIHAVAEAVNFLRGHVSGARDAVIDLIDWFRAWLAAMQPVLQVIVNTVGGLTAFAVVAVSTGGVIVKAFLDMVAAIASGTAGLKQLFSGLWDYVKNGFLGLFAGLGSLFTGGGFEAGMKPFAEAMAQAADQMASTGIGHIATQAAANVAEIYRSIEKLAAQAESAALPGLRSLLAQIRSTLAATGITETPGGASAIGAPPPGGAGQDWYARYQQFNKEMGGAAHTVVGGLGQAGGLANSFMSGFSQGGLQGGMAEMVAQFVMTSQTFKTFSEQFNKIVQLLQKVLEPLAPVLTEVADILSEVAQVFVAFIRPYVQIQAQIILPVLKGIADLLQNILALFGIKVDPNSLNALAQLSNPTITLRLDTSAAMQSLQRAEDAMLGAATDQQREIARQAYLSARQAAVLAAQNEAGTQGAPLNSASLPQWITDFIQMIQNIVNFLSQIWDVLANTIAQLLGGIWSAVNAVGNAIGSLGGVFSGGGGIGGFLGGIFGFADGSNLTSPMLAGIHANEAILPSRFNPSSPSFDINAFWAPVLPALQGAGGGGAPVVVVIDSGGNVTGQGASALGSDQANQVLTAMRFLQKRGDLAKGTVK